jgi:hypothetical protein
MLAMTLPSNTPAVPPTWEDRDLPVLRAVVEIYEQTMTLVSVSQIEEFTGFSQGDVQRAVRALADSKEDFFEADLEFDGTTMKVKPPTGAARRAAGNWPTPDALADRLVAAFNQAADEAATLEQRSKLKELGLWAAGAGRALVVEIVAKMITRT